MPFLIIVTFLCFFSAIISIPIFITYLQESKKYRESSYYKFTKLPYWLLKKDLGKYGEYLTYKELTGFEKSGAKLLFNIYIPKENGETTEIDVLMIHPKGIFVFESKNYSGFIFGSENQKYWTQTLKTRKHVHKESFYNPIMQNNSHITHLNALINRNIPVTSLIVFSNKGVLNNITVTSKNTKVINCFSINRTITSICEQTPTLIPLCEINSIYTLLLQYSKVDTYTKIKHINTLKEKTQKNQSVGVNVCAFRKNIKKPEKSPSENVFPYIDKPIMLCPKCNSSLVLRTAKKGTLNGTQFYGCSNYPRCKYTKSL